MTAKKLPVGIENFEEIRKQDFYYVDKTGLIVDLLAGWGKVNLFTRPRRFGKTLNMSMLKCFFEIGGDKSIFDGLTISRENALCETYMGKYPVVFISLKGVDGLTFDLAYQALCGIVVEEFSRLRFLTDSDKLAADEKQYLEKMLKGKYEEADIRGSLKKLSILLEKRCGQKVILLIDEYDVPLDKAYADGDYAQMIDLIRAMFGAALKTNDSLFFAVLTGCLRNVEAAYKTINWESIVLIAAMLPMSVALEKTGASELLSRQLAQGLGSYGPVVLLAGVYFTTSLMTMFISNTATAVLLAPVALHAAVEIGASPYPFLFAVAVGASMCFASPFSTPPNALVMQAGQYAFKDYIKVGLPLQVIMGIIMILILPLLFPF